MLFAEHFPQTNCKLSQ